MKAYLVAGLGFGDEGKGAVVDYLVRTTGAKLVVRYNGGPQAAHNVVAPDERHHTFSQIGSGYFAGASTYISQFMCIEPYAMVNEAQSIRAQSTPGTYTDPLSTIFMNTACPIVTPFHWHANRLRELARGRARHGSCGMGVGELHTDLIEAPHLVLTVNDLLHLSNADLRHKLRLIRDRKFEEFRNDCLMGEDISQIATFYTSFAHDSGITMIPSMVHSAISNITWSPKVTQGAPVVFEGAQGMLIDRAHGFAPYNSWTNATFSDAFRLLPHDAETIKIGVLRTYPTRHGPGPFPTEYKLLKPATREYNEEHPWQGPLRHGFFDTVLAQYATEAIGLLDGLALTHIDQCTEPSTQRKDSVLPYVSRYRSGSHGSHSRSPLPGIFLPQMKELTTEQLMGCHPTEVYFDYHYEEVISNYLRIPLAIKRFGPRSAETISDPKILRLA